MLLAPTDAALGQAVVTQPRLPSRIRQGLNVESGLNDGICVPLLLIALAVADVEAKMTTAIMRSPSWPRRSATGSSVAWRPASRPPPGRDRPPPGPDQWILAPGHPGRRRGPRLRLGGGTRRLGLHRCLPRGRHLRRARPVGVRGRVTPERGDRGAARGVTFLLFGAVLLGPSLKHVSWQIALYAGLSLTLVRMLPVAIAMSGSSAKWPTVGFLGWFGPRGLASIVFAVITVQQAHLARRRHDPARDVPDHRPVRVRPRNHGRAAGQALRPLVRDAPARPQAADGKRPRATPPRPLETASPRRARVVDSGVNNRLRARQRSPADLQPPTKNPAAAGLQEVGRVGIEPTTLGLRGPCSAS